MNAGSRLDLILDVTRRVMSITDLDTRLRHMATVTTQLLDADRATIFIVDRERGEIWSRVAPGDQGMSRSPDTGLSERDRAMPSS